MSNRFISITENIILELKYEEIKKEDVPVVKIGTSSFFISSSLNNKFQYFDLVDKKRKYLIYEGLLNILDVYQIDKQEFLTTLKVNKLKLHFVQNFYFEQPIYLNLTINQLNNNKFSLGNFILSDLNQIEMNSNPFVRNGKLFNSYYEVEVPSIEFLNLDWLKNGNSSNSISRKIFGNFGINSNSVYEFEFGFLNNLKNFSDDSCFGSTIIKNSFCALPTKDNLEDLNVFIRESNDGDYLECGFSYVDGISLLMEDFASIGKNFYISNEIAILEYIPYDWRNPIDGNWELTDTYQILKEIGDYESFKFRPILKRDDVCPMFKINYIGKLIDSESGEEIWKEGSFISTKTRKYNKKYPEFSLYQQTPVISIIEQNSINILNSNNTQELFPIIKTELIPVWFNSVLIESNNLSSIGTFKIPHFSNSYIVEFYFSNLNSYVLKNCILEFINSDGTSTTCSEVITNTTSLNGHISFQISEDEAKTISKYTSKSVRIIKNNLVLAFGTWEYDSIYSSDLLIQNYKNLQTENLNLKKEIEILKNSINIRNRNFEIQVNPFEIL